jgi:cell division protein ZapA
MSTVNPAPSSAKNSMACSRRAVYAIFAHSGIMSAPVKVEIFGQTYSIQGDLDQAYVQKLAKYVDEKMNAIADVTRTVDTQKVAVLAALAIADELHGMQRERSDREELLREQAERCLTLVERALKQTA